MPRMTAQAVKFPTLDLSDVLQMAVWFIAIMLVAGVGMLALRQWQKRIRNGSAPSQSGYNDTFPLEALDKLLADGQITPDEYKRLRRARLGLGPGKRPPADSHSSPPAPDVDAQ